MNAILEKVSRMIICARDAVEVLFEHQSKNHYGKKEGRKEESDEEGKEERQEVASSFSTKIPPVGGIFVLM